jgi:F0F1-type ATP synthase assembly protein I
MSTQPDPTPAPDPVPNSRDGESPANAEASLGTSLTAYLLSGPLTFGGLGWLADRLLSTSYLVVAGSVVGVGLSIYVIWLRYGR